MYSRTAIDDALAQKPQTFKALLELLTQAGYQVTDSKVPALLSGDQKRFLRMDTLARITRLKFSGPSSPVQNLTHRASAGRKRQR